MASSNLNVTFNPDSYLLYSFKEDTKLLLPTIVNEYFV